MTLVFLVFTQTGSKQLYENGVSLRSQYSSLFPTHGYFRLSNMKVTSSSSDRCIASLSSFMAGFFPPQANDKTIPFRWQAFPFAVDNEYRILSISAETCPTFARDFVWASTKMASDPTVNSWLAQDKALLKRVGDYMGSTITTFFDAFMAAETIRTQQYIDPATPTWLISAYVQMKRYFVRFADMYHETELMKKVRGGPMITEVIDNMVAKKNKDSSARNFVIFSAHDFSLVSLMTVLGVKKQAPEVAAYGDTIAIEMHQTGSAEPEVKIFYISNSTAVKFRIQLYVPNCGTPCRLTTFNNLMSKYIVRDFDALCKL